MKMYLYPSHMDLSRVERASPFLFGKFLENTTLTSGYWTGSVNDIPDGEPSLIRCSSLIGSSPEEIGRVCAEKGHLAFYDDALWTVDGLVRDEDEINAILIKFFMSSA